MQSRRAADAAALPAGGTPGAPRMLPWAAMLLGSVSVLDILARNRNQASLADAAPALAGSLALALAVWGLAVAWRRRADAGAALIACVWVVGLLFYLDLARPLNKALGGTYPMLRPLPVAVAAMVGLTLLLRGRRPWHGFANTVAISIAVALLAGPAARLAAFEWRHGASRQAYDPDRAEAEMPELARAGTGGATPDIYHLVFDRYGSEETLTNRYGIRDPIGPFLERQGFYVARDSFANYLSTGHSLASTFHMDYLAGLAADPRVTGDDWHPIFAMLDDNRVGRFLRARGYEMHQFGSWWAGTFHNPDADSNQPFGLSEFDIGYLRRTILLPLFHLLPEGPVTRSFDWDNGQCQRVARQVEAIKRVGEPRRPVYVFAHILVPHGPYVFRPDGSCMERLASEARGEMQGYADQVGYADRIIEELVTTLLAGGRRPAAILIQADEGPIPERDMRVPWQDAPDAELRIKFGILAAYRFPDGDYRRLRQDISPVNSYRTMLGHLFGVALPELPDRMIAFPDHLGIYDFQDVTERVRCATLAAPPHEAALPPC